MREGGWIGLVSMLGSPDDDEVLRTGSVRDGGMGCQGDVWYEWNANTEEKSMTTEYTEDTEEEEG